MSTWSEVIQRANADPAFRAQLKADPAATCRQAGCEVPTNASVEVIEDSRDAVRLFLGARTRNTAINGLLEKAESDPVFKQRLLASPRAALEAALGQSLPPAAKVSVHEHDANCVRLLLAPPAARNEELSDQELEMVAGGGFFANVRDAVGDFFCRDQPVGITHVSDSGSVTSGVGYLKTRSGNLETADKWVPIT